MDFSRFNQAEQAQINTMIEQKQVKLIKNWGITEKHDFINKD
jgi:hypothetical protein